MESSDCSFQSPSNGLFNGVLHSSVAAPVMKLRLLKVAYLQGYNVMGKIQLSPLGF